MKREELLAPPSYNLVSEIEKYTGDKEKLALIWQDDKGNRREVTYAELMKGANKIGNAFIKSGLQKGDKLLIMMPRLIEAYMTYIAAIKAGFVVIPSSEMLRKKDIEYRIGHGEVKAIVSYEPYIGQFDDIEAMESLQKFVLSERSVDGWINLKTALETESDMLEMAKTDKEDMVFLSYTSGTTGNPKGVVHTHAWAYAHLRTSAPNWLGIEENDVVWATASPGWQKWIWSPFLATLGSGATGFVYHGKFEPKTYLNLLDDNKVNVLCCTPTEYRLMAKVENLSEYNLEALHSAVSAGEPLNREVIETFQKHFHITVRDGYGQTENTLLVGVMKGMDIRPGSMGKPTPGNHVDIVDEEGMPVRVGEVGDMPENPEYPVPAEAKERVLHATLKVGNTDLMISDTFPGQGHAIGSQVTIAIQISNAEKAKEVFDKLQEGGEVIMPLQETFWSPAYGQVKDKFNIEWQVTTSTTEQK
ncbi:TPA: AMP-binding protein [Bacillus anthracis]|nr:AMP-binding protein [Bacillus anthracis]